MYLTVHRVRSSNGRVGINGFLYRHENEEIPGMTWDEPNISLVADEFPGKLSGDCIQIRPGPNEVLSYLDVVCRDGMHRATIDTVLGNLRGNIVSGTAEYNGPVSARFYARRGLAGAESQEFDQLRAAALALFDDPQRSPWRNAEPLVILVEQIDDATVYRLEGDSQKRVDELKSVRGPPISVRVSHAMAMDFRMLVGEMSPELAKVLTGLDDDTLLSHGGARFIDSKSRLTLREWPARQ